MKDVKCFLCVVFWFSFFPLTLCIAARKCWTCGEFYSTGRQIALGASFLVFGLKLISENFKTTSPFGNHKTCFNIVKQVTVFTNSHHQELFCLLQILLASKLCSLWCTLYNPFQWVVEFFFLTCYPVLERKTFFSDYVAFS